MRSINSLITLLLLGVVIAILANCAKAAPEAKMTEAQRAAQVIQTRADGTPPMQEQVIVLDPFYLIRQKDAKVWVERIIVTLALTTPKPTVKHDLNGPMFRTLFYDLIQSGKPEDSIQTQAVAGLHRQLGMDADAEVHLSRSILIVR
jgi:hypothetical protein